MAYAAKLEVLETGEVSLSFFNKSETWEKLFSSIPLAAKEAERLGVFDSTTRRQFEHATSLADLGYLDRHVEVRVHQLESRGYTQR